MIGHFGSKVTVVGHFGSKVTAIGHFLCPGHKLTGIINIEPDNRSNVQDLTDGLCEERIHVQKGYVKS